MKKILLTSICTLALAGGAYAQGLVAWNTINAAALTVQTNVDVYSPLFGGGNAPGTAIGAATKAGNGVAPSFYYTLLYTGYSGSLVAKPTDLVQLSTWQTTGLYATNGNAAGFLSPVAGNANASVPWANGTTQSVMLVGWSANLGTTWAAALSSLQSVGSLDSNQNYFLGLSNTGYLNPALAPAPGVAVFSTAATAAGLPINSLNTQLYLIPVPEPSTIALAGLGGLALLALRRRK